MARFKPETSPCTPALCLRLYVTSFLASCFCQLMPFFVAAHDTTPPPGLPVPPTGMQGPDTVSVTTGVELQQAIRDHARHIVINDHMDLTRLPKFSENTVTTTAVGVIEFGTDTIRGNCSTESHHTSLQPPRQSSRQCVLDIFEDFVELRKSDLWLHDIYLRLVGDSTKDHATYFGAHNGNLWLTQCVMRGDGFRARAVDTYTPWKGIGIVNTWSAYELARSDVDTIFSRFSKAEDAVWRFRQGTTAAFARCTFMDNVIPSGAQGSVIGARILSGEPYIDPSYIWIQECKFSGNQPEDAAVIRMHQGSRVYTDTPEEVTVWDSSRAALTTPWQFRPATPEDRGDDLFNTSVFLSERDIWFTGAILDQAAATGLPAVEQFLIPSFVVARAPERHASDTRWRRGTILMAALIACCSICASIVAAAGFMVWYITNLQAAARSRARERNTASLLKLWGSQRLAAPFDHGELDEGEELEDQGCAPDAAVTEDSPSPELPPPRGVGGAEGVTVDTASSPAKPKAGTGISTGDQGSGAVVTTQS